MEYVFFFCMLYSCSESMAYEQQGLSITEHVFSPWERYSTSSPAYGGRRMTAVEFQRLFGNELFVPSVPAPRPSLNSVVPATQSQFSALSS